MKKPDLLIMISVWEFLAALGAFICISAIAVFAFPETSRLGGVALAGGIFGLSVAVIIFICYACIAIAGGIGLLNGKEWGRVLSIVHATLSLICIPFGTIIGVLVIIYLAKAEVREYFEMEK